MEQITYPLGLSGTILDTGFWTLVGWCRAWGDTGGTVTQGVTSSCCPTSDAVRTHHGTARICRPHLLIVDCCL